MKKIKKENEQVKHLDNCNGFSLVELLVAAATATIVIAISATILTLGSQSYKSMNNKLNIEEDAFLAELTLRTYLSGALNVTASAANDTDVNPADMNTFSDNVGKIRRFSMNNFSPASGGGIETIAFFLRENLSSGHNAAQVAAMNANAGLRYPMTGIFIQKPIPNKYGVIYIKSKSDFSGPFKPDGDSLKIQRVVDFEVMEMASLRYSNRTNDPIDNDLENKQMVSSILLKVVFRHYLPNAGTRQQTWCPPRFMNLPECRTELPYVDTEKTFQVSLRNNILERTMTQKIDPTDPTNVNSWAATRLPEFRRSFDTIYFLKTSIPIGEVKR